MADFEIDGFRYSSGTFDGSTQMKVSKRLLPVFTALIGQAAAITAATSANEADARSIADAGSGIGEDVVAAIRKGMSDRMAAAVLPVSREMAALSDEAEDFIVNACLNVTQWFDANGRPYPVREPDGSYGHQRNRSLAVRMKVTFQVLADNFGEMFSGFGVDVRKLMTDAGERR